MSKELQCGPGSTSFSRASLSVCDSLSSNGSSSLAHVANVNSTNVCVQNMNNLERIALRLHSYEAQSFRFASRSDIDIWRKKSIKSSLELFLKNIYVEIVCLWWDVGRVPIQSSFRNSDKFYWKFCGFHENWTLNMIEFSSVSHKKPGFTLTLLLFIEERNLNFKLPSELWMELLESTSIAFCGKFVCKFVPLEQIPNPLLSIMKCAAIA